MNERGSYGAPPGAAAFLGLLAATFLGYVATFDPLSDGQILGNDVVPYAHALVYGGAHGLWNPHHLLFHPVAAGLARVLAWLEGAELDVPRALFAQQVLSALGAALSTALLFRFAARLAGSVRALLLALAFAVASGNWLNAAVGETYAPALAALTGCTVCALEVRLGMRADDARARWALAGWLTLAVLLRQDSVLVVPALAALLPLRTWVVPVAGAGVTSLVLYTGAWQLSGTEAGLLGWLKGLAETGLWGGSWVGWDALWTSAGVTWTALSYASYLSRLAGVLTLGLGMAALVFKRRWRHHERVAVIGLTLFTAFRFVFYSWWQPGNMEYHTGHLMPLFLVVALFLLPASDRGPAARLQTGLLANFLVAVGLGSWFVLIAPSRDDLLHRRAQRALELVGPWGTIVSLDRFQHYAILREEAEVIAIEATDYMPYAPDGPERPPGVALLPERLEPGLAELRARIDDARDAGHPVLFPRDTVSPWRTGHPEWPFFGLAFFVDPGSDQLVGDELGKPGMDHWGYLLAPR